MKRDTIKRALALLLVGALALLLAGCGQEETASPEPTAVGTVLTPQISVYASFYPLYALALNVVEGVPDMELHCLVQPQDGCLRSYSLSDWDLGLLVGSGVVILGGHGLESFESYVMSLGEEGPAVLIALDGLDLLANGEAVEGDEDASHFMGENPWAWMSVERAMDIVDAMALSLSELDANNAELYEQNAEDYKKRLENLEIAMAVDTAEYAQQPVALMHEGLAYFAEELNLNVVATIEREPGTQAEDQDLEEMIQTLRTAGAQVLLVERQIPEKFRRALTEAGFQVAAIDTLSTHTADGDARAYETYMKDNVRVLNEALEAVG